MISSNNKRSSNNILDREYYKIINTVSSHPINRIHCWIITIIVMDKIMMIAIVVMTKIAC